MKFKVGDRVRRNCDWLSYPEGTEGVIANVTLRGIDVVLDNGQRVNGWAASCLDPVSNLSLPIDSEERKTYPMYSGLLAYFPAALARVAHHSFEGNQKHNPGKPLQHARNKSGDHADCIVRHLVDSHELSGEQKLVELQALCWRSLALLQEEAEKQGAPIAPAATFD